MFLKNAIRLRRPHQALLQLDAAVRENRAAEVLATLTPPDVALLLGLNRLFLEHPAVLVRGPDGHDVTLGGDADAAEVVGAPAAANVDVRTEPNARGPAPGTRIRPWALADLDALLRAHLPAAVLSHGSVQAAILAYFCETGNVAAAESFYGESVAGRGRPAAAAVVAMLRTFAAAGAADKAEALFERHFCNGALDADALPVSTPAVNTLLRAHGSSGARHRMHKLHERMGDKWGLLPDAETFLALAEPYSAAGQVAPVVKYVETICGSRSLGQGGAATDYPYFRALPSSPRTAAYNLLLRAHLSRADAGAAGALDALFRTMTQVARVPPDHDTLALMIAANARPGQTRLSSAHHYFAHRSGVVAAPSRAMFEALLAAHVNAGESDRAWRLYGRMLALGCPRRPLSLLALAEQHVCTPERLRESLLLSGIPRSQWRLAAADLVAALTSVYPALSDNLAGGQLRARLALEAHALIRQMLGEPVVSCLEHSVSDIFADRSVSGASMLSEYDGDVVLQQLCAAASSLCSSSSSSSAAASSV